MKYETGYLWRVAGSFSQFINTLLLNGHPDESISGRVWRNHLHDPKDKKYQLAVKLVNTLFFFEPDHCRVAYEMDIRYARARLEKHNQLGNE